MREIESKVSTATANLIACQLHRQALNRLMFMFELIEAMMLIPDATIMAMHHA